MKNYIIFFIFTTLALSSCDRETTYNLENNEKSLVPYLEGEKVTFVRELEKDTIKLFVSERMSYHQIYETYTGYTYYKEVIFIYFKNQKDSLDAGYISLQKNNKESTKLNWSFDPDLMSEDNYYTFHENQVISYTIIPFLDTKFKIYQYVYEFKYSNHQSSWNKIDNYIYLVEGKGIVNILYNSTNNYGVLKTNTYTLLE